MKLFLDEPYYEYQQACTDDSADEATDDTVEINADETEESTCYSTSDNAEDDVEKDAVIALHDDAGKPS